MEEGMQMIQNSRKIVRKQMWITFDCSLPEASLEELFSVLENETNINCRFSDGNTPLTLAVMIYVNPG